MTAGDWRNFETYGPPQVGEDVILLQITASGVRNTLVQSWNAEEQRYTWTHWTPFIPPAKEDGFEKWWPTYSRHALHFYKLDPKTNVELCEHVAKAAFYEGQRQAEGKK
jgi:hypothetical protein